MSTVLEQDGEVVAETSIDDMIAAAAAEGLFEPGKVYAKEQISNALYHAGPGESSTNLKHANVSALHYITYKEHPKPSTPAMRLGTLLHSLVLEPDTFDDLYVREPDTAPRRPTERQINAKKPSPETLDAIAWWERWDAENAGKEVIGSKPGDDPFWKPSEWDQLHYMRDAVMQHDYARLFLENFIAEQSFYWLERVVGELPSGAPFEVNELCKARYDISDLTHEIGADLKTANDASYSGFVKSIFDFGYHISRSHYLRGAEACGRHFKDFVFIVVEKEPPWAVGLYTIDGEAVHQGDALRRRALEVIARSKEAREYPCYPPHVRELVTPGYAKRVRVY